MAGSNTPPRRLRILMASAEALPMVRGGGLAEVVGALAAAVAGRGHRVDLLTPWIPSAAPSPAPPLRTLADLQLPVGGRVVAARLLTPVVETPGVRLLLLDLPEYFQREGIYGAARSDFPDNCSRFVAFSRAVVATPAALKTKYDVLHTHDWPTGLAHYYLAQHRRGFRAGVFTFHNVAYQGNFWALDLPILGLGPEHHTAERLEFFGKVSFLKAGIQSADRITTVSPSYAREVQSQEGGMGMDGLLRARAGALSGILGGLDESRWDPQTDKAIHAPYARPGDAGHTACRNALADRHRFPTKQPIFAVSCSSDEDAAAVVALAPWLATAGASLVVLGDRVHPSLVPLAAARLLALGDMSTGAVRRTLSGADFFLVQSRVEPFHCAQMAAFRYGAVNVVRRTGALRDTVVDVDVNQETGNGLAYLGDGLPPLQGVLQRALALFADRERFVATRAKAAQMDISAAPGAAKYEELYMAALEHAVKPEDAAG